MKTIRTLPVNALKATESEKKAVAAAALHPMYPAKTMNIAGTAKPRTVLIFLIASVEKTCLRRSTSVR